MGLKQEGGKMEGSENVHDQHPLFRLKKQLPFALRHVTHDLNGRSYRATVHHQGFAPDRGGRTLTPTVKSGLMSFIETADFE